MKKEIKQVLINEENLKNKIYIIRGQKVMLDSDLAEIYGYSTKDFNRQVKNNINKFPDDFMFRLTKEEFQHILRCKIFTSKNDTYFLDDSQPIENRGGVRYLPYVFTEQGIYMLMTVLKGPLAIKQSILLIRLFKSMKDYINENRSLLSSKELELRTSLLEKNVNDNTKDINIIKSDLNKVMDNFTDPSSYKEFLILNGNKLEADIAYRKIIRLAKKSIIYIDDYINLKTLQMFSSIENNVNITLITDNKAKDKITSFMIKDFNNQYPTNNIKVIKNGKSHDRFIIIDFNTKNEKIYHCGASLKDAGNKITTITKLDNTKIYRETIKTLLSNKLLNI